MVTAMTASQFFKNSTYLLSALLISACQPSSSTDETVAVDGSTLVETPVVITDDSVTMTSDHILSIKPSRYQPSVGLQGTIEPVKQVKLMTAHPVNIEEVLVIEGQLVEKGTPLLIVRRVNTDNNAASLPNTIDSAISPPEEHTQAQKLMSDSDATNQDNDITSSAKSAQPINADNTATTTEDENLSESSSSDNGTNPKPHYDLVTVRASFTGRIEELNAKTGQRMAARMPLLQLNDETQLHFVATLPIQAEPQLSIGQTVNFTADDKSDNFTGQVSKLTETSRPKKLLVHVDVINNKASRAKLIPDMKVAGRVNYGQIDVGTIVPKRALHDVDLTELQTAPYKPLTPLTANVWIIGQDQRLLRRAIEVIEYNPTTKQYLIAGISNDSLICLADLPVNSKGKRVIVS